VPGRSAILAIILLFIGGLWACWCDVAMIWDGAYQFAFTLIREQPYFYLSRAHSYVLWLPVTWLEQWTSNVAVLKAAYGLPLCLAPAASAALSWWVVRRAAPHLFLWAAFGSAIGTLPGQIFMINDSIFQMHALWPVFLATFVPLTRGQLVAMLLLSVFQLSHPIGIIACAMVAAAALAHAQFREPERRGTLRAWAAWFAVLAIGGVLKLYIWPDDYAAREATWQNAFNAFLWGVMNWPLPGLLAMWLAAGVLAWKMRRHAERDYSRLLFGLLAGTALVWTVWGADTHRWNSAINYRRWVLPMSLPFFAAAFYEAWLGPRAAEQPSEARALRGRVAVGVCAVFVLTLGSQSASWLGLWRRLERQVAETTAPMITPAEVAWTRGTPLDHWGVYSEVLVLQGREPHTFFLDKPELEAVRATPPRIALGPFTLMEPATGKCGWFQWRPVVGKLRGE
jgi:hypothetical protein